MQVVLLVTYSILVVISVYLYAKCFYSDVKYLVL